MSLPVPRRYSNLSLNKCLFVSVCLLCFCSHLHSCCFLVLNVYCLRGCLLCMLCFLYELFPLIPKCLNARSLFAYLRYGTFESHLLFNLSFFFIKVLFDTHIGLKKNVVVYAVSWKIAHEMYAHGFEPR